ncbi:MAG: TlyA family RNA methyltransferase [Clostridia bacterium]|nr:TlyA family RNA methyltransferase [Clostridia bacterium]
MSRLDKELLDRNLVVSRAKAKVLIDGGNVYVNGKCCKKCSLVVNDVDEIEIRGGEMRFVSRGGYKLLKAIETFSINLQNMVCMDVGASTGGFTDCMLQHGADKVYAVDVGTNQLVDSLRQDRRVVSMEQVNFRYMTSKDISESIDFASVDVSFISLEKILPPLFEVLSSKGRAVCLIKPQFEAGKENIGKNGIVRNQNVHLRVLYQLLRLINDTGFTVLGLTFSPVKGSHGNIEYLVYITKEMAEACLVVPEQTVKAAYQELGDTN